MITQRITITLTGVLLLTLIGGGARIPEAVPLPSKDSAEIIFQVR